MEKYIILENYLKELINNSEPHSSLPSLSQIMNRYGVSTTTARKALSDLNNQGVIYTVNGKGSFVSPHYKDFPEIYCVFQGIIYKNNIANDTGLFPFLLEDLCTSLTENNMEMIFSLYKNSVDLERQILKRLPEKNPYGAIIYATGKKELFPYYQKLVEMIPNTVFIDRYINGIKSNFVGSDNYNGAKLLGAKIKDIEFDKIFFIDADNPKANVNFDRKNGFFDSIGYKECIYLDNDSDVYEYFMTKLIDRLKIEFKKNKRVCIFGINSVITQEIYIQCYEEIKNLEFCQFLCFEKTFINKTDNISVYWAKQNVQGIADACVKIIKENKKQKQEILYPVTIEENN